MAVIKKKYIEIGNGFMLWFLLGPSTDMCLTKCGIFYDNTNDRFWSINRKVYTNVTIDDVAKHWTEKEILTALELKHVTKEIGLK